MAGISSKALFSGNPENKFKYNGKELNSKEFSDGSGLEAYDFGARMQDPQLGRWWTVDPMVSNYYWLSPYNYCNNNPTKYLDPNGMEFTDTTIGGKRGKYDVATLDPVVIKGKSKKASISRATEMADYWILKKDLYGQARYDGWSKSQMFEAWSKHGISKSDLEIYESRYQRMMNFRNVQMVTVGVLGVPVVATTAPGMFAVSADLALPKMVLSFGIQSFFNGIENVDYFDVAADGFTGPGLNGILNGAGDIKPFSNSTKFRLLGRNKSFSQFGIDAAVSLVGGGVSHATWEPLTPFLNNYLEKSIFYISTQSWISSTTQGANSILTNEK